MARRAGKQHASAAAAVEAVQRIQRIELVTDAPAIIVRRTVGEAINRNRDGDKLGRNIAHFAAPENLPGNPQTFSGNAKAVGPLDNWHGFSGWACDRNDAGTSNVYEFALPVCYLAEVTEAK